MDLIHVIIIADDACKSKEITDILHREKRVRVIDQTGSIEGGVKKVTEQQPEVVIVDIPSPQVEEIELLENIIIEQPVSVLILYDEITKSGSEEVQALFPGAVYLFRRPSANQSLNSIGEELIQSVISGSQVKLKKGMLQNSLVEQAVKPVLPFQSFEKTVIAIGTSTGGPRALENVFTQMPKKLPGPVLVVQHMPAGFTKSLAERLNRLVDFSVKEAENLEVIHRNTAYIAPGGCHMKLRNRNRKLVIELSKDAPFGGHRPSVDVLLHSIAEMYHINKIAVILTGMGSDGADGIRQLKSNDPNTVVIAESQETAVIYGMPRAAVNTNMVDHVVPLSQVGKKLINIIGKIRGE